MSIPVVRSITAHCVTCLEPVDLTDPHAIGSRGYYHRACFDASHPQMLLQVPENAGKYFSVVECQA